MVTINFKVANKAFNNGFEVEYSPENGIYQFRILRLTKDFQWEVVQAVELEKNDIERLMEYLTIMSKMQ
jgi:hypothetical protein